MPKTCPVATKQITKDKDIPSTKDKGVTKSTSKNTAQKKTNNKHATEPEVDNSVIRNDYVLFKLPNMFSGRPMIGRVQDFHVQKLAFLVTNLCPVYRAKSDPKVDIGMVASVFVPITLVNEKITLEMAKKYAHRATRWSFNWSSYLSYTSLRADKIQGDFQVNLSKTWLY